MSRHLEQHVTSRSSRRPRLMYALAGVAVSSTTVPASNTARRGWGLLPRGGQDAPNRAATGPPSGP